LCGSAGGETTRFYFRSDAASITQAINEFFERYGRHAGTPVGEANDKIARDRFKEIFFRSLKLPKDV
jgi:hypothetical protein